MIGSSLVSDSVVWLWWWATDLGIAVSPQHNCCYSFLLIPYNNHPSCHFSHSPTQISCVSVTDATWQTTLFPDKGGSLCLASRLSGRIVRGFSCLALNDVSWTCFIQRKTEWEAVGWDSQTGTRRVVSNGWKRCHCQCGDSFLIGAL